MIARMEAQETEAAIKRKRETDDRDKRKRQKKGTKVRTSTANNDENDENDEPLGGRNATADGLLVMTKDTKKSPNAGDDAENAHQHVAELHDEPGVSWTVSQPMGGRMLDIDPILNHDEEYLIIAYSASIHVYSASDSLLVRSIPIPLSRNSNAPEQIFAMRLCPCSSDIIWVASSLGRVWPIKWTSDTSAASSPLLLPINRTELSDMIIEPFEDADSGAMERLMLVTVANGNKWSTWACHIDGDNEKPKCKDTKVIVSRNDKKHNKMYNLRSAGSGQVFAASLGHSLIVASRIMLKSKQQDKNKSAFDALSYGTYVLDCADEITSLDIRLSERVHMTSGSLKETGNEVVVDVVVGCTRGAIYIYNDLLLELRKLENKSHSATYSATPRNIIPKKKHWHRKAVHAVKWSQDGNYLISGGSETVLVLHQLDTNKCDFLPHLSASIENIVVSDRGSSYALRLDDNSAMVLSTAEMKPTAYVSGIQSHISPAQFLKDDIVRRLGQERHRQTRLLKLPAAIDPRDPSRILVSVGNSRHTNGDDSRPSMPLVQTVDISTVRGIFKQAVTRTHPTDVNTDTRGCPLTEPQVAHLTYSKDGKWLATVDEWQPPLKDISVLSGSISERREVHLKFWSSTSDDQTLELVSRINAPHYNGMDERVLGLAADPSSYRFASLGEDGLVRIWQPMLRERDGIKVKGKGGRALEAWTCTQTIHLHESKTSLDAPSEVKSMSGALAFSEDGSLLLAAFQKGPDATVYIVDAVSGEVVNSLDGLSRGTIQDVKVLDANLIILSNDLVVYNLVADQTSYGIDFCATQKSPNEKLRSELAVDYVTGNFLVAVSRMTGDALESEVAVFSADNHEPGLLHRLPNAVVATMTTPGSSGFLLLDSAAQLWSINQGSEGPSIALAQPLADLKLETGAHQKMEDEENKAMVLLNGVDEEDDISGDEMEVDDPDNDMADDDDDQALAVVVPQQKLTELFDVAPPFAMPPIEDMFMQVAKLFSAKEVVSQG